MPDSPDLSVQIDNQIRTSGPMSLSTYMRLCLSHPRLGYYRTGVPLGAGGDFVTAPEISQTFGEMIGVWIANAWQTMGSPPSFDLVELGPGRGTLMADAVRVLARVPGLLDAARVLLAESSPELISEQKRRLAELNPQWITEIAQADDRDTPLLVIANEFFDALPVKQYQKADGAWHERVIGLEAGKRVWGLDPTPLPAESLPESVRDAEDGAVWESARIAADVMTDIAERLARRTGALLAIDYGYDRTQTGDTFQAIAGHDYADPLAAPGEADLTTHVDFAALAEAARTGGAAPGPLLTQAQFLTALGIEQRHESLAAANPGKAEELAAAVERLTGPEKMGTLFKCLCVASGGLNLYPFDGTTGT